MLVPIIAVMALSTITPKGIPAICHRCHFNKGISLEFAAIVAANRAHVKPEPKAIRGLVLRESGWSSPSRHLWSRRSTAYGFGQFLNSTWKSVGIRRTDCTVCQIEAVYKYCHARYGSVIKAVHVWDRRASRRGRNPVGGWY